MIDLHVHSVYSDGNSTIDEIAKRAKKLGLKAVAVVDHSIELYFGLTEAKAKKRQIEIDNASSLYGIKIYSGIECSIDAAGEIMLPDFDFDFIIASVHEFIDGREYYERVIRCMENNEVDVIGHPLSMLFGFNNNTPEMDMKLIEKAEEFGVAIELNSSHKSPPESFLELCIKNKKVKYSIGSDAHEISKVGDVGWSVERAKRYMAKAKLFNP